MYNKDELNVNLLSIEDDIVKNVFDIVTLQIHTFGQK